MENILTRRLIIHAIENRLVVAPVVECREFRGIEKPAGSQPIDCQKVSKARRPEPQADVASRGTERSVTGLNAAKSSAGTEPRARGDIRDQAALVPELRLRSAGCRLHALDRADRKLG